MSHRKRRGLYCGAGFLLVAAVVGALTFRFQPSSAATPSPGRPYPPANGVAVSLGDSYIAGEGARWIGNADNGPLRGDVEGDEVTVRESPLTLPGWLPGRSFAGKKTASLFPGGSFTSKASGEQEDPGCHRSDAAEILVASRTEESAGRIASRGVNLACSGAETRHLLTEGYKGERPQIDQLAALVARGTPVTLVVVSIGGNDLDVSGLARDCAAGYFLTALRDTCVADSPLARADAPAYVQVGERIRTVLGAVKGVFTQRRLPLPQIILQSYPRPLASLTDLRPTTSLLNARYADLGYPFDDEGATLIQQVVTHLNAAVRAAALDSGVSFLDAAGATRGHELGHKDARLQERNPEGGASQGRYGPGELEWVRWVDNLDLAGRTEDAQRQQESLHPNYLGTQSQAACLKSFVSRMTEPARVYDGTCVVAPGGAPSLTTATTRVRAAAAR
ncbi:GDSL-type esterase/lipase family protein [Streptomyces sp. NPDC089919]|uniref:GDSL-type esterase/lipase family protein n=1 Tax=Streptomyces sp. NPDC089919 TaxID=3155188 RepID=UPI003418069E